eukprot:m.161041 g.161041  ORF g.161041 m.161041 type:complete len:327 (-) comp31210_c2_seq1:86-1066(-)
MFLKRIGVSMLLQPRQLSKRLVTTNNVRTRLSRAMSNAAVDPMSNGRGVSIHSTAVAGTAKTVLEQHKTKQLQADLEELHSRTTTAADSYIQHYGEDACFVNHGFVAVADGVGGWKKHNINPAIFSSKLMGHIKASTSTQRRANPGDAMIAGYKALRAESPAVYGGSTACVAHVDTDTGRLRVANLGDSGWRLLRAGKVIVVSEEQRHSIFTPWQLSLSPEGHEAILDLPETADLTDIFVESGDVLILGTDGLFDNVYDDEIDSMMADLSNDASAQDIASELVCVGVHLMMQRDRMSPFAMRANDDGFCVLGGKVDDITVVTVKIE